MQNLKHLNLVTVVGHNITMLPHMLDYYQRFVDNIFIVVYRQSEDDGILQQIEELGITPYKVVIITQLMGIDVPAFSYSY